MRAVALFERQPRIAGGKTFGLSLRIREIRAYQPGNRRRTGEIGDARLVRVVPASVMS